MVIIWYTSYMDKTFSAQTSITINAPVHAVWALLTDPAEIKKYLHGTDTATDWVVGHGITWSGEWDGKVYVDKGEVLAFEPDTLVKTSHWSPLSGTDDKPENYHVVAYELSENGTATTLTLTQSSSPTQEDADNMVKSGWEPILQQIKRLAEGK